MKSILIVSFLLAAPTVDASSQLVPDSIHSEVEGASALCGFTGENALDLIRQVTTSPTHRRVSQTDRFEYYLSADRMDALVFTRLSEPAYPAITCRHLSQDAAGNIDLERTMRCDAGREVCERLFLEFASLDDAVRRGYEGRQADQTSVFPPSRPGR